MLLLLTSPAEAAGRKPPTPPDDPPIEELINYYPGVAGGAIQPISGKPDPSIPLQDFFKLDVAKFNRYMNAPDLIEAKKKFFAALPFDSSKQEYDRAYWYLKPWRSLNHPQIKKLDLPHGAYRASWAEPADEAHSPYFKEDFQLRIDEATGTEMTYGNKLRLVSNRDSFEEKLRMVRQAKRYFYGTIMFFACDTQNHILMDAMIDAARRGVEVKVVFEKIYGITIMQSCVKKLRNGGVSVELNDDSVHLPTLTAVMHDKFWIRDGEEAVLGGQNMHDGVNLSDGYDGGTRDTDVLVESGPAVTDIVSQFITIWRNLTSDKELVVREGEVLLRRAVETATAHRGRKHYGTWLSRPDKRMNGLCRLVAQSAKLKEHPIAPALAEYIQAAQSDIVFTGPGVDKPGNSKDWNDRLVKMLKEKATSGVPVDLISNGIDGHNGMLGVFFREHMASHPNDVVMNGLLEDLGMVLSVNSAKSARKKYLDLIQTPGFSAYTYSQYIHSKLYFFDRIASFVGSFNMDKHSSEINNEATLICLDRDLAWDMEDQLLRDVINSVPVMK